MFKVKIKTKLLISVGMTFFSLSPAATAQNFSFESGSPIIGATAANIPTAGSIQEELFREINQYRKQHGLHALSWNKSVANVAQNWSHKMQEQQELDHNSNLLPEIPEGYFSANENVAMYPVHKGPEPILKGWKASLQHHQNLLENLSTTMGIGVVRGTYKNQPFNWVTLNMVGYPSMTSSEAPTLIVKPQNATVVADSFLGIKADFNNAARYQWQYWAPNPYNNDVPEWQNMIDQYSNILNIDKVLPAHTTKYRLIAANDAGITVSDDVHVKIGALSEYQKYSWSHNIYKVNKQENTSVLLSLQEWQRIGLPEPLTVNWIPKSKLYHEKTTEGIFLSEPAGGGNTLLSFPEWEATGFKPFDEVSSRLVKYHWSFGIWVAAHIPDGTTGWKKVTPSLWDRIPSPKLHNIDYIYGTVFFKKQADSSDIYARDYEGTEHLLTLREWQKALKR